MTTLLDLNFISRQFIDLDTYFKITNKNTNIKYIDSVIRCNWSNKLQQINNTEFKQLLNRSIYNIKPINNKSNSTILDSMSYLMEM